MTKQTELLKNLGENAGMQYKAFYKSHDLAMFIQITLLSIPILLAIISLAEGGVKILDIIGLFLSIFALIYHISYGKNQELYNEWGNKYLNVYRKAESYYKKGQVSQAEVEEIDKAICSLNKLERPTLHVFAKQWVNKTIRKETTYANEQKPRWE